MAEPSAFQVVVRLRPVPPGARHCFIPSPDPHTLLLAKEGPSTAGDAAATHQFAVDRVFGPATSQPMFFTKCIHPLVSAVVQGVSAAVFCYGPSKSGRRYTLEGDPRQGDGMLFQTVAALLQYGREVGDSIDVRVSALCMFVTASEAIVDMTSVAPADIRTGHVMAGGVPVGVCQLQAPEDLFLLLQSGQRALQASRVTDGPGHAVVTLLVQQRHGDAQLTSRLHFVRLAASDRAGEMAPKEETARAQKTFAALSSVVSHVAKGSAHIPYRDSRLTSLLRDTLNRHSLGLFICTLHAVPERFPETLRAAKYARRLKQLSAASVPQGPFVGRFDQFREQFAGSKGTTPEPESQRASPHPPATAPPAASPPPRGAPRADAGEGPRNGALVPRSPSPASTVGSTEEPQPYQYSPKMYREPDRDDRRSGGPLAHLDLGEGSIATATPPLTRSPASPPVAARSPPPKLMEGLRLFDQMTLQELQTAPSLLESASVTIAPTPQPPPLWLSATSSGSSGSQRPAGEVEELRRQVLAAEAEAQAQRREQDALRTELIAARQGLLASRARRDDYLQELEPLRSRCQEATAAQRRAEGEQAEHWKAEARRLTSELTDMRQTVVTAKHQMAHLTDTIQELQISNKGLQDAAQQKDAEGRRLEEQLGEARADAARLQAQVADLTRQLVQLPDLSPLQPREEDLSPRPSTSPHLTALERQLRTVIEERDALADDLAALHGVSGGLGGPRTQGDELYLEVLRRQYATAVAERRLLQRSLQASRRDVLELQQERTSLAQALLMAQRLDPPPTMSLARVQSLLSEYHRLEKDLAVKALQLQEQHEEVQLLRLENSDLQLQVQHLAVAHDAHVTQLEAIATGPALEVQAQAQVAELEAALGELQGRHAAACEAQAELEQRAEAVGRLQEAVAALERQLEEARQAHGTAEATIQHLNGQVEALRGYTSSLEDRALATRQALDRCRAELRQREEEGRPSPRAPEPARPLPFTAHEYHRLMTRAAHLHETLQAVARMIGLAFTESIADVEDCRAFRLAFQAWLARRPPPSTTLSPSRAVTPT